MEQTKENKMGNEKSGKQNEMFVVGLGASAGGLEALQQFFRFMPSNSGLSFVVVQHLAPDYKSLMADILGKYTEMPVIQAENGMENSALDQRKNQPKTETNTYDQE